MHWKGTKEYNIVHTFQTSTDRKNFSIQKRGWREILEKIPLANRFDPDIVYPNIGEFSGEWNNTFKAFGFESSLGTQLIIYSKIEIPAIYF